MGYFIWLTRRITVKISRVSPCLTKSGDPQRGPAFYSISLGVSLIVLSLILILVPTTQLMAQSITSGDVVGVVTDPSGAVLANASVTLKNQENGRVQAQSTNSRGAYRFSLLPPGSYTVSVTAAGFHNANATAVVTIGQAATVNIALELGEATSTVEVTSDAQLLQTDNADVSTSFSQAQISQVPNPGNDLSYIAQTAPGVVQNTQGGNGHFEPIYSQRTK
jgi:Carboxypeptidase regulatory-like domain